MPGRWRRRALYTVVLWLAALAAFAAWGGCTSEDPNPVGAGLGQTAIDTVLRALTRDQMSHLGVLDVVEPTAPLDGTEVLYLGSTGRDASSILVNYDFSVFDHPDSAYLLPYLLPDDDGQTKIAEVDILLYL
ncbi:MAG: hypothetical protein PHQ53_05125, partial [Candidatus Krumholzibacteria bacterium]|nr:hypothetical protein [Candidatus Krumholzibacteria bacterium]